MIENILKTLAAPLFITLYVIASIEAADTVQDDLKKKKYASALFITVIAVIFYKPMAIFIAIYIGYKIIKQRKNKGADSVEKTHKHEPEPGSTSDYERWKKENQRK